MLIDSSDSAKFCFRVEIIIYEKRRRSLFLAYLKDTGLRIAYPTEISNAASPRPCTYIHSYMS